MVVAAAFAQRDNLSRSRCDRTNSVGRTVARARRRGARARELALGRCCARERAAPSVWARAARRVALAPRRERGVRLQHAERVRAAAVMLRARHTREHRTTRACIHITRRVQDNVRMRKTTRVETSCRKLKAWQKDYTQLWVPFRRNTIV